MEEINKIEKKAVVPTNVKDPKKMTNRVIGVILCFIILYFGPIAILMHHDLFEWIRSSDFLCLVFGTVGLYVLYALVNPDKFEFVVPKGTPTIIQVPAECAICGRTFERNQLVELPASRKLLCKDCAQKWKQQK